MPNRHGQSDDYRYGWNGAEKDDEIRGTKGASYDLGARMYDPRIGRMLSVDPWTGKYAWQSPYVYHGNSPIAFIDWKGYGKPGDRKANTGIKDHKKSNKSAAGTRNKEGIYADVSMTNGNTNNPAMAFPDKIAAANNMTTAELYALNPGLKENRHSIGQGQFIRTKKSSNPAASPTKFNVNEKDMGTDRNTVKEILIIPVVERPDTWPPSWNQEREDELEEFRNDPENAGIEVEIDRPGDSYKEKEKKIRELFMNIPKEELNDMRYVAKDSWLKPANHDEIVTSYKKRQKAQAGDTIITYDSKTKTFVLSTHHSTGNPNGSNPLNKRATKKDVKKYGGK